MSIYDILSSKTPRVVEDDDLISYKEERKRAVEVLLLITLCAVNIATQGSRFSLNFVFYPHLQTDLALTDTEYGILSGMGFSVIMVGCMIPWGLAADNALIGRRNVILVGLLIQGLFCSLQGAAWGFWSLLFIRFGLAAGQSAIQAPCLATLAKFYQDSGGLATANALFTMGIYIGGGLASLGGELAYVYGWQTTFGVFGMLCFIGSLAVLLTVPDDRIDMLIDADRRARSPRPSLTESGTFRYFLAWFSSPAPALLTTAGCLRFMAGFCLTSFLPVYFQRHVAKDPSSIADISIWYGIITTVSGCISVVSGGYISDSLLKAGVLNAPALVSAAGSLAAVPFTLLMFFAPVHESVVLLFLFFSYLATWLWMGPSTSIAQVRRCGSGALRPPSPPPPPLPHASRPQELLPKHLHATGLSVYLAICTLFGTLGPIIVGSMQDTFGVSLRSVLAFMLATNYFLAGILLLVLAYMNRDGVSISFAIAFVSPESARVFRCLAPLPPFQVSLNPHTTIFTSPTSPSSFRHSFRPNTLHSAASRGPARVAALGPFPRRILPSPTNSLKRPPQLTHSRSLAYLSLYFRGFFSLSHARARPLRKRGSA